MPTPATGQGGAVDSAGEALPTAPARARAARRRRVSEGRETAIWDGLIRPLSRPETGLSASLLYPLRGATGVVLLVLMPPLLWITSVPFITAAVAIPAGNDRFSFGLFFLLVPAGMAFLGVFGYTLLFLGRVAASSALGDCHHPRWPDWELSDVLFGLGRWVWAGLVGVAVGGFPAVAYWVYCGDVDLFDALILGDLLAVGAAYALMALLASILHEDALAANPFTVLVAIRRVGWGYAPPCLLAGFAAVLAVTVLSAALKVEVPWLSAFLFWAFWFLALYEAMVVLRVLGLFYRTHAGALGWFHERSRWRS